MPAVTVRKTRSLNRACGHRAGRAARRAPAFRESQVKTGVGLPESAAYPALESGSDTFQPRRAVTVIQPRQRNRDVLPVAPRRRAAEIAPAAAWYAGPEPAAPAPVPGKTPENIIDYHRGSLKVRRRRPQPQWRRMPTGTTSDRPSAEGDVLTIIKWRAVIGRRLCRLARRRRSAPPCAVSRCCAVSPAGERSGRRQARPDDRRW